ncbi:MAG: response regulator transcription factor [Nocardioidaceae bacterium]|nr:response regulator transcription factor [Nocardioidaceae bacterium]
MAALLIVEDDPKIGVLLANALSANGHTTTWQRSGASALHAAAAQPFDLVLLDLGLPDVDGVDVCRELRRLLPGAIIVILTARRDEMDVIVGLESGADDYLTKPFRMTELLARVRAHLRRSTTPGAAVTAPLGLDELTLDTGRRECQVRGTPLVLRPKEFDLLVRLARDSTTAVSRETLMADVWDENWFGSTKTLDVHVASLRRALAELADSLDPPGVVPEITTLRGFGYRLDLHGQVPRDRSERKEHR